MSIRDVLIPALQRAFPDRDFRVPDSSGPIAVFPPSCAEVGSVAIYDDGDEATVLIENVTHHHVNPYDLDMSEDERNRWIAGEVITFLRELFSDQVLLWSIRKGQGGGGWRRPYDGSVPGDVPKDADIFVWSRCIQGTD